MCDPTDDQCAKHNVSPIDKLERKEDDKFVDYIKA